MSKRPDMEILDPTPVEKPLVAAIREHREEWPYIYVEMKGVCKEDLLADAEYCARHRHPSMTQFYRECGKIAGMHESMLRKFERAGRFYDRVASEFPASPQITDGRVAAMSPDTLILVDRIDAFLAEGAPSMGRERLELVGRLVDDLLGGRGLRRKELNAWLASLQDAAEYGGLERSVNDFLVSVTSDAAGRRGLSEHVQAGRCLESLVRPFLQGGEWLLSIAPEAGEGHRGRVEIVDAPALQLESSAFRPDFIVIETLTGKPAVHMVEAKSKLTAEALDALPTDWPSGADCAWFVTVERPGESVAAGLGDAGIGLMVLGGSGLEVIAPAARRNPPDGLRADLYGSLLAWTVTRRPKPSPSYEHSFVKA